NEPVQSFVGNQAAGGLDLGKFWHLTVLLAPLTAVTRTPAIAVIPALPQPVPAAPDRGEDRARPGGGGHRGPQAGRADPAVRLRAGPAITDVGAPPGVFNLMPGSGEEVGEQLTRHPGVDQVSFTGSTLVGRRVAAAAAQTVKRVTLELGGKSASVVLSDVDDNLLASAVKVTVADCYLNGGQTCPAPSRLTVPATQAPPGGPGSPPAVRAARCPNAATTSARPCSARWIPRPGSPGRKSSVRYSRCSLRPATTPRSTWRTTPSTASAARYGAVTASGRLTPLGALTAAR